VIQITETNLSRAKKFWVIYAKNRVSVIGLAIVILFSLLAIFAPLLVPGNPWELGTEAFAPPSWRFPFGTDDLGRTVLSQIIYGSRVSMIVGFTSSIVATIIGIIVGGIAGYFGGAIDDILMRITELFMVIPRMVLIIVLVAFLGPSLMNVLFAIILTTWTTCARITRGEFLSLRELEYVMAAKGLGVSSVKIIFGEILPNAVPPIMVNTTLQIGTAILMEAGLGFLGLSDPNMVSWGYIISNSRAWFRYAPWPTIFSGLSIFLSVLGFNLVGDGLNDALDPRLRNV
jgi:peptide/nickel transport system permease protein